MDIVSTKRAELRALQDRAPELEAALEQAPEVRDFRAAISVPGTVSLIAECKRRSPGAGPIRPALEPAELTRSYENSGAAASDLSSLQSWFLGF